MKKLEIGIVIIATNAYFVLGLRFIRRFLHFYKGDANIIFHMFSDKNPMSYLPNCNIVWHPEEHYNWRQGTNSKFRNIIKLNITNSDYLFYFDADTNIQAPFSEEWMLPETILKDNIKLIGGEHYSNRTTLKDGKGFDRTKGFNSYVPLDSPHPYTYHYGAFFGGEKEHLINMMTTLAEWQMEDQKRMYEPPVNDESYINKYFHYHPPYTIPIEGFKFVVSDKGGLGNTRRVNLNLKPIEDSIRLNRDELWDIQNGQLTYDKA